GPWRSGRRHGRRGPCPARRPVRSADPRGSRLAPGETMMTGRVAVVTGAARGIGAATVLALAGAGWSVLAVDSAADDPALPYPMGTPPQLSRRGGRAARAPPGRRAGALRSRACAH